MLPLKKSFFTKDTIEVARNLLGCHLVRKIQKGVYLRGQIVETEAYLGAEDSCCHSYKGLYTDRTKPMYLEGGHAYVYFTYGMHHCFNIVTSQKGNPEAVLIRALEPLEGLKTMMKYRKKCNIQDLTTGPAKLCQAFRITRDLNGQSLLTNDSFHIEGPPLQKVSIEVDARIGLSPAKEACYWPLRFYIKNHPYLSTNKNWMK